MDDFGGKLRQARERRGISLRQIAASTKIAAAALDALERNDISKLPGGIFSRAFVRSYAIEVGLDPDDTVREFLERFNQEPAPTADAVAAAIPEEERQFQERQRKAARMAIVAAAVLVVLIGGLVFAYRARVAARRAQQDAQATTASAAPAAAPDSAAAEPDPPPASAPVPSVSDRSVPPATAAGAVPAGQLRLEIHPTADCWVSVTADGRKVFARVMPAGEKQTIAIAKDATVEIGDAGAFAYAINGKPGKSLGDKGQVTTLKLTPATAAQFIQ
jgi:cytoskeletal protein RodZ